MKDYEELVEEWVGRDVDAMLRHEALQNLVSLNKKGIGLGNRLKNIKCTVVNDVLYICLKLSTDIFYYIYQNISKQKEIFSLSTDSD